MTVVGVTQRDPADDHLVAGNRHILSQHRVEVDQRRLRARVQSASPGGQHQRLQEQAGIHQRAFQGGSADGENDAHRRAEETVVAAMVAAASGGVVRRDAERVPVQAQFFPNTFYKKTNDDTPALGKFADLALAIMPLMVPVLIGIAVSVAWYRRTAATRTTSLADRRHLTEFPLLK